MPCKAASVLRCGMKALASNVAIPEPSSSSTQISVDLVVTLEQIKRAKRQALSERSSAADAAGCCFAEQVPEPRLRVGSTRGPRAPRRWRTAARRTQAALPSTTSTANTSSVKNSAPCATRCAAVELLPVPDGAATAHRMVPDTDRARVKQGKPLQRRRNRKRLGEQQPLPDPVRAVGPLVTAPQCHRRSLDERRTRARRSESRCEGPHRRPESGARRASGGQRVAGPFDVSSAHRSRPSARTGERSLAAARSRRFG
jgi:hypothetical protein